MKQHRQGGVGDQKLGRTRKLKNVKQEINQCKQYLGEEEKDRDREESAMKQQ